MDDHLGTPISPERLLEVLARWSPDASHHNEVESQLAAVR